MKKTLRHKAYEEIKKKIVYFELKPGEPISDTEICAELDLGRTPVREALIILEKEKLVRCTRTKGYFVRKISQKEAEEYFQIRTVLELYAVPLIIKNATNYTITTLESIISESEICADKGDIRCMAMYNTRFHETLYQSTDSEAFIETISGIFDKLHWLRAISLRSGWGSQEPIEDHKRIVEAIKIRNSDLLKEAIETHLKHARDKVMAIADIVF